MTGLPRNRNAAWDRVIADTLVASGVARVILCPGGRNGLLAMTLHRTPGIDVIFHVDERSAAFVALGAMLADGRPSAVCTTSGSAVINLIPALAEAAARGLPLVLLTCDRPMAGRLSGEPQTLPQSALCAPLAQVQLSLPDPLDGSMGLAELRDAVGAALADAIGGQRPGPIHINIPQWGAYCATEDDPPDAVSCLPCAQRASAAAVPRRQRPMADQAAVTAALAELGLSPGRPGIILAGQDLPVSVDQVAQLAAATGLPVIADICSGLRHHDVPGMVTTVDALAEAGVLPLEDASFLLRLGGSPVSPGLVRTVKAYRGPVLSVSAHEAGGDFLTPQAIGMPPPTPAALDALAQALGTAPSGWSGRWAAMEMMADIARDIAIGGLAWGELAAAFEVVRARGFATMHCANSLSVRFAGLLAAPGNTAPRLFSARGVNGTDGTLGLILGEAIAANGPMLALVGDQAFTHDLPALANPRWADVRGAICVMNNAGGGLFDLTAARAVTGYAETMRNAPAVSLAGIADAFGLDYHCCRDRAALAAVLADSATSSGPPRLVDIAVPPGTPQRDLPVLLGAMGNIGHRAQLPEMMTG